MARNFKSSRPLFASSRKINSERFKEALRAGSKDALADKIFEAADRRRGEIGKLQQTIFFLQLPVFIYLVLLVSGTDVNLNMFGITATKNLREALIVVSAGLGLWSAWLTHQAEVLESLLRARHERMSKGNANTLELLNVAFGIEKFTLPRPSDPFVNYGKLHLAAAVVFVFAIVTLLLLIFFTIATVHYMTLLDIYRHPNFGPTFTWIVMGFVVLADTVTASWLALQSGVVPFKNSDRLMRLNHLYDTAPARAQALVQQMVQRHYKKGWLRRTFTRPTLPPMD
ncbi:hypothetical protein [Bradyrhizobium liaoningense]|uniref:hypothetical protein n=1 Tax=Bradyrhizobium liaoningense TaxID=43992 RepID=UPI001BACE7A2|nr:hypothetical protein [Bradyrhizobium liaoningense]MBR0855473.1 hypothetical protein [Bradyrhizobium liaoningense]